MSFRRSVPWTSQPQGAVLPGIGAPALLWNAALPSANLTIGGVSGAVTATRRVGASGIYQDCLAAGAKVQFPFITSLSTATKWTIYFRANWSNSTLNYQSILSLNGVLIIRTAIEDAYILEAVYWNIGAGQVQRHRTAQGTTEAGADYAFVMDEAAGRAEIWRNGVNIYTTGVNWFAASRTTPTGIAIGDDDAGAVNAFLNGGIQYSAIYLEAHSAGQIASVQANPWQLFAPLTRQLPALTGTISRPGTDVAVTGWTFTGASLAASINEPTFSDASYGEAPYSVGSAITTLDLSLTPGSYTISFRGEYLVATAASGQFRFTALDGSNTSLGVSSWQAVTSTVAQYDVPITVAGGTAVRLKIEIQA
jgi:hypothetical protein